MIKNKSLKEKIGRLVSSSTPRNGDVEARVETVSNLNSDIPVFVTVERGSATGMIWSL